MAAVHSPHPDPASLHAQAQAWIVRLTSGQATAADAQAFKAWCRQSSAHAQAMSEMTRVWDLSRPAGEAVAQRLRTGALVQPRPGWRPGRRAFLGGALAAGVCAYAVVRPPAQLWPALSDMTADYHTGTGEQRQLVLSDAVVVEMNTQTSLNLQPADVAGADAGALQLLGGETQVLLRTAPSAPFVLTAGGGRIVATDAAQFNVRATGPDICLTCLSGTVELGYRGRSLHAQAQQQIVYGRSGIAAGEAADLATVTAWRERVLVFNDEPLSAVVDEINRYRPGRIVVTDAELGRRKVQAQMRFDQLAGVVDLIRVSYGARVTSLPGGIVLLS